MSYQSRENFRSWNLLALGKKEIEDEGSWGDTTNSWGNQQINLRDDKRNDKRSHDYDFRQGYYLDGPGSSRNANSNYNSFNRDHNQKYFGNQHKFNRVNTMTIWEETSEQWANNDDTSSAAMSIIEYDNERKEKFAEEWTNAWGNESAQGSWEDINDNEMRLKNWSGHDENVPSGQEWGCQSMMIEPWNNKPGLCSDEWNNQEDSIMTNSLPVNNMMDGSFTKFHHTNNDFEIDSSQSLIDSFIGMPQQFGSCSNSASWNNGVEGNTNFMPKNDLMMDNFWQNNTASTSTFFNTGGTRRQEESSSRNRHENKSSNRSGIVQEHTREEKSSKLSSLDINPGPIASSSISSSSKPPTPKSTPIFNEFNNNNSSILVNLDPNESENKSKIQLQQKFQPKISKDILSLDWAYYHQSLLKEEYKKINLNFNSQIKNNRLKEELADFDCL